jgi:hypothetical protein
MEHGRNAARGELPSGLRTRKPTANDVHWRDVTISHAGKLGV